MRCFHYLNKCFDINMKTLTKLKGNKPTPNSIRGNQSLEEINEINSADG